MTGCSAYQIVAGGTPVDVTSQKLPHHLPAVTSGGANS
jgi:hypothetical protein